MTEPRRLQLRIQLRSALPRWLWLWGSIVILGTSALLVWVLSAFSVAGLITGLSLMMWMSVALTGCMLFVWWNERELHRDMREAAGGAIGAHEEAAMAGRLRECRAASEAAASAIVCFGWVAAVLLSQPDTPCLVWWLGLPLWGFSLALILRMVIVALKNTGLTMRPR